MENINDSGSEKGLFRELERLLVAAEENDYNFLLSIDGLSEKDADAVLMLKKALRKYRSKLEYDAIRYELTCKSMGMVMWHMDVVDGDPLNPKNTIIWSQELREALGFTDEKDFPNVFSSWIDRLHPEDREHAVKFCIDHILDRSGKKENDAVDLEFRVKHKNGEYRHFLAFGATLRDEDGKPLKEAGSWLDITERKKEELQILDMNENLILILDAMSVGVRIVRIEDNQLVYANKASMDIFGCEDFERDVLGKSAFDFMPEVQPDGRTTVDMANEFFKSEGVPMDFQCFKLNGESFIARITSRNIKYYGKMSSLAIIEDVTKQKRAEEQAKTRELMTNALNETSVILISRNEKSFEENMTRGINPIADIAALDRISIWRNSEQDDGLHTSMVYRWDKASGGTTKITEFFADVKYSEFAPNWVNNFYEKKVVNGPVKTMPKHEAGILSSYGVKSIFIVPVYIQNIFTGFVFYEDREDERYFDDNCAEMLRHAAYLLVNSVTRFEADNELAEIEKRTKLMLDASPLCCQLWDKNIKTIDCNDAAVKLYKFKNKQEYMDRFMPDCHPEYQPDGQRSEESAIKAVNKALKDGRYVFNWMHRIPSDGSLMPAEITLCRVKYKNECVVVGYTKDLREHHKMLKDITYKETLLQAVNHTASFLLNTKVTSFEDDLYESIKSMAKAVDVDRVAIWKVFNKNNIKYCNLTYEWSHNAPPRTGDERTKSVPFSKLPSWQDVLLKKKCINGLMRDIISTQGKAAQELLKEIRSILVVPVFINDVFWGFVGFDDLEKERIFTETEEQIISTGSLLIVNAIILNNTFKALRETSVNLKEALNIANKANKVKSVFLANMSHEIRTPMNSIMGFAELARQDTIPEKTEDYLTKISENAEWMLHIINDILDISKIESGKIILEQTPFDVHDIYEHCKSMIMPKVLEKGLSLYCYAEPSIGKKLLGDPIRLRQIITNLLSNAVKFTNSGTIKLLASIVKTDGKTATIHFEVKDSGIGMTSGQIEKIFDPFTQADDDTTRRYSGTGLGLTITKNLVELMNGNLKVVSAVGIGSNFSFEIPFELVDVPVNGKSKDIIAKQIDKPHFNAEILICEDNYMNQQVVCDHLQRVGIKTVIATNGQEGIDIISERLENNEKLFDLIFMDIHMPVMDGLEASAKISEKLSDANVKIPIIALTANIMLNNLEMYTISGMEGYLGKPFNSQELYKCLLNYLNPLNYSTIDISTQEAEDEKLLKTLQHEFVKSNQTTFNEIITAISNNEIELAHRITHTIKSSAANINEVKLQESAAAAESMLKNKENRLKEGQLEILEKELKIVLRKYAHMLTQKTPKITQKMIDKTKKRELLQKLEVMLTVQDMECMNLLDEIRTIAGTEELIEKIENFDFEQALLVLNEIRK